MPRAVARLEAMASTAKRSTERPLRWASARATRYTSQRRLFMLSLQDPHRFDHQRPPQWCNTPGYGDD